MNDASFQLKHEKINSLIQAQEMMLLEETFIK